jgi:hypothetical protein
VREKEAFKGTKLTAAPEQNRHGLLLKKIPDFRRFRIVPRKLSLMSSKADTFSRMISCTAPTSLRRLPLHSMI